MDNLTSRSAMSNKANLEHLLQENNVDIALLPETWFKPNRYVNFGGYNAIRQDRIDGKGGVAILIKSNLPFQQLMLPTINDRILSASLLLNVGTYQLCFVSIYVRPKTNLSVIDWNNFFASLPKPFIVCGDVNSHHTSWGCGITDSYGRNLLDSVDSNQLIILNNGSPTMVVHPDHHISAIDLSICTPNIAHLFDWNVLPDPHGSDHLPILLKCQLQPDYVRKGSYRK